jgi:cyclopropane fatty-acyl-phospholipid synthase-like methyltransferase
MESRDLDPDEVVDIYDELLKTYKREWEQRGHRSLHFGYYDEEHTEPGQASMNTMRVLSEALDIDGDDRILNIGCGAGEDSVWNARAYGAEVVGVNISETQLELARENAREHDVAELTTFANDDFHELSTVDDGSVDVVWGLEAISHSPDVSDVLDQARRVLRPGGRIGITDMFTRSLNLSSTDSERIQTVNESLGVRVGNIDDFREALEAAGFENIRVRDLTEGVEESAEQRYRFARMAHPGYRLLGAIGRASETQIDALEGNAAIYRLVRDGTLGYYLITADVTE